MTKTVAIVFSLLFLTGCASQQKYAWNGYDNHLYAYYKAPADKTKFVEYLKQTILIGERKRNVPPGIYAEYGYFLYENQDYANAIVYFKKEHDSWPESCYFMNKMISNAQKMTSKGQTEGSTQ